MQYDFLLSSSCTNSISTNCKLRKLGCELSTDKISYASNQMLDSSWSLTSHYNAVQHLLTATRDTVKLVNFNKLFTGKGAEHHPEFFTNDRSWCPEYMCKFSWISLVHIFTFWSSRKLHFCDRGMGNVHGGRLTICRGSAGITVVMKLIRF